MKRRYVQINGELVEVASDYIPLLRTNTDAVLWNDRTYQDIGDSRFSSRTQHRAYMKEKGVTLADDYKGEWRSKEAARVAVQQGYDPTRKQDLERAISQLNSRRK